MLKKSGSYFEDSQVIKFLGKLFRKKRGKEFVPFKKQDSVILFVSGGLDSINLWHLLLKKYNVHVYPLFIKDGSLQTKPAIKAIAYFSDYFKKRYPKLFHEVYEVKVQPFFSFANVLRKNIFISPELVFSNTNLLKPLEVQPITLPTHPGRLFYYCSIGYEYLLTLRYKQGIKVNTILTGITPNDSWSLRESTKTVLRSVNFAFCTVLGDYSLQFSGTLEKQFFYTKQELLKYNFEHGLPLENTWSCVGRQDIHCGKCPNCRMRKRIFKELNIHDPTSYIQKNSLIYSNKELIISMFLGLKRKLNKILFKSDRQREIDINTHSKVIIPPYVYSQIEESKKIFIYNSSNFILREYQEIPFDVWKLLIRKKKISYILRYLYMKYSHIDKNEIRNQLFMSIKDNIEEGFLIFSK